MSDKKNEIIINQSLDLIMSDRFGRYSKYIIQGRALPDVRDGLKPVQRRILFSMRELGLHHNKPFKKSARVVGDVIGKYHPHGDSSIYEAMVRMSQDWKSNLPLVEMHGNNGSIDDDPAAAMRYTEARLSKASGRMLDGIKKNTVAFAPNFDDSESEPTVMPGLVPNLLVNGAKGIAAGYATEMPPHNLGEVVDAIIAKIKSPNARLDTLLKHMKGPDFPTGGTVMGADGIYQAFERGKGRVVIRSKYTLNESKTSPSITITEIPYGVVKSKLARQIDEIRLLKKIAGIKEVRDDSGRNGISIFIQLTAGTEVQLVLKYLLSKTDMQIYYNYNNITIIDQRPEQVGIIKLINAYLKHQKDVQKNRIKFDLAKDMKRLEILQGLIKVATMADKVIDAIRAAKGSRAGVITALKTKFKFTDLQANAIADLRLYRLSSTDQGTYQVEADELTEQITKYNKLLDSPETFDEYLIELLKDVKENFATPRKTIVEGEMEKIEINMEELIKHEDAWVTITRQGYIKRFSNRAYEANKLIDFGLKPDDSIVYIAKANTANKMLAFTNDGKYVFVPIHKIADSKWKDIGKHINDHAAIGPEASIIDAAVVEDFDTNASIAIATKSGKAKRTPIRDFEVTRYSRALTAMKLAPGDQVIGAKVTNNHTTIVLITSQGKAVKYAETEVSQYSTKSSGIKSISLPKGEEVTAIVAAKKNGTIGLVSKRGGAKRIKLSSITPMTKSTQGKQMYRAVKGNPHITIDAAVVSPKERMIFLSTKGDLKIESFSNVDITTAGEGFSQVGTSQTTDARILTNIIVSKKSDYFTAPPARDEKEVFEDAEAKIDAVNEINIDDLLKDI